ncbi:hypothetical protein D3C81_1637330 [compost metagenome]
MLDNFSFGDILLQILFQHPLDKDRIRPNPPQETCRFKGARAGMEGKMLRIDRNPGEQHGRLQRTKLDLIVDILQQLCHKLAG